MGTGLGLDFFEPSSDMLPIVASLEVLPVLEGLATFETDGTSATLGFEILVAGGATLDASRFVIAALGVAGVEGGGATLGVAWARERGELAFNGVPVSALGVAVTGVGATAAFRELSEIPPHTAMAATATEVAAISRF